MCDCDCSECFHSGWHPFFLESQAQCVLNVFDSFVDLKNFLTPTKSLRLFIAEKKRDGMHCRLEESRGSKWWIFWQSFFSERRSGGLVVDLPFAPTVPETWRRQGDSVCSQCFVGSEELSLNQPKV